MTDPFSIAAGVAGIVAVAGSTSKVFYQFFRSIHDAPSIARDLTASLYSLNVALSQIQGALIDPAFVAVSDDEQLVALQECLANCTATFKEIKAKIRRSGLADDDHKGVRKAWKSVKASFSEKQMEHCMQRTGGEKGTLSLILGIFSARLNAGVLTHVQKTEALVKKQGQILKKQDRRLKDIHIFCQWVVKGQDQEPDSSAEDSVQKTEFLLSSVYETEEISNLLQSSGSVLSLTLSDVDTDTVSAVWEPGTGTQRSLRCVKSTLQFDDLPRIEKDLFRSPDPVLSQSLFTVERKTSSHPLEKRIDDSSEEFEILSPSTFLSTASFIYHILANLDTAVARVRNQNILNEGMIQDTQNMTDSWTQIVADWILQFRSGLKFGPTSSLMKELEVAMQEYLAWCTIEFDNEHPRNWIQGIAPYYISERRLMVHVVEILDRIEFSQSNYASKQILEEPNELQREASTQLQALRDAQEQAKLLDGAKRRMKTARTRINAERTERA